LGFSIAPNVIEEGLCLYHHGYVVIGRYVRIGKYCQIHSGVNIGENWSSEESPVLGNNIFIGPGAKIFGSIHIADNIAIGANAVVNTNFEERNITIAGIPARKVRNIGNRKPFEI
jgi:serine O-acetyltransferase